MCGAERMERRRRDRRIRKRWQRRRYGKNMRKIRKRRELMGRVSGKGEHGNEKNTREIIGKEVEWEEMEEKITGR
jgi:hypothetical protein